MRLRIAHRAEDYGNLPEQQAVFCYAAVRGAGRQPRLRPLPRPPDREQSSKARKSQSSSKLSIIWLMSRLAIVLCLTASMCLPQSPSTDPLLAWLDRIAQHQLDDRERAIAAIRTQADANQRKATVRARLTELIGGLPMYNGPLHARVTGRLQCDTHTIEKVIFESLPGFYITANLYRPNTAGRYPAVLMPAGHTQEGKPEAQIV